MAEQQIKKTPLLDDNGNELLDDSGNPMFAEDTQPNKPPSELEQLIMNEYKPPERGMIGKIWNKISSPLTDLPSRIVKPVADAIDAPRLDGEQFFDPNSFMGKYEQTGRTMNAAIRGGMAGSLQGVGDLLTNLTSPLDLTAAALSGGASLARKAGLSGVSSALASGARLTSVPVVAHGAINTMSPDSTLAERGAGLMEIAGGASGMRAETPRIGKVADEMINPNTAASAMPAELPPIQPVGPKIGQSVRMKDPTIDNIAKARREGWEIDPKNPMSSDGKVNIIFTGKKMDEVLEADVVGASVSKDAKELSNKKEDRTLIDALNTPRTIMASFDLSAPLRQGIGLIHKPEFRKALIPMVRSFIDENYFNELQKGIAEKPLFKARQEQVLINGKPVMDSKTGKPKMKEISSFAEDAGIKLTDIGEDLTKREESMMSRFADAYPGVTRSNRAYVAFLNKLRADTFESLMKTNNIINPYDKNNAVLAKEMASFINNATGRGSLDFGKVNLEKSATALNTILFSPRLISSRLQMMNPGNYLGGNPAVRKEYLKSILAIGVAGNSVLALGSQIPGTSVEMDPRSKDFAKLKFENGVRIDPWAGFQQYLTQTTRQIPNLKNMGEKVGLDLPDVGGVAKSSETGNLYRMGEKFGTNTRKDEAITFVEQKMNPVLTLITRAMAGKDFDGTPFNLPEEVIQRFVPIFLADLKQLATENPDLLPFPENYLDEFHPENLPFAIPAALGMGMQQYQRK